MQPLFGFFVKGFTKSFSVEASGHQGGRFARNSRIRCTRKRTIAVSSRERKTANAATSAFFFRDCVMDEFLLTAFLRPFCP